MVSMCLFYHIILSEKPETFWDRVLDHDDFGLIPSKIMNVIDSKNLARDAGGKPVSTLPHPALGTRRDGQKSDPCMPATRGLRNAGSSTVSFQPLSCAPRSSSYIRRILRSCASIPILSQSGTGRKSVRPCAGPLRGLVVLRIERKNNHG